MKEDIKKLGTLLYPTDLFQEGLTEENVHEFSFAVGTGVGGTRIPARGYKFVSVLTNGAFNPFNNYNCNQMRTYLSFNAPDKHILSLNREFRNIPLIKVNDIFWHNGLGVCFAAGHPTWTFQGGYGGVFIILHNYPITTDLLKKNNPYVCEGSINVAAATTIYRWIGMNRPNADYVLALPWIPIGYDKMTYSVLENGASVNWNFSVIQFNTCNDIAQTIFNIAADTQNTYEHIYSNRFQIVLINNDLGNAATFHYQITFLDKSDNN